MTIAALGLAVGFALALGLIYRRDLRRANARRSAAFEMCAGLLEDQAVVWNGADYPGLTGRLAGWPVEVTLWSDTIQWRKLPILWMMVTLHRPMAVAGVFDLMLRPANTEDYSPHGSLSDGIPTPPGWDRDAVIRTDAPAAAAALTDTLTPHVDRFLEDQRGKEMLITPKGIRLVWRLDESSRGHYLAFRQPQFEHDQVSPEALAHLLAQIGDIAKTLTSREGRQHVG